MAYVAHGRGARNTRITPSSINHEPALTRGGRAVKRKRPDWSAAVCNVAAELAGIGKEVRHAR